MKLLDTEKLYNENYCKKIDAKEWRFRLIPPVVKILNDHFKPNSVVDIGCANGLHLKAFKDLGVKTLIGIEGTKHWGPYIEKYFGSKYYILNLRDPWNFDWDFDLVMSFEVLEHIEKEYSAQAVDNICSLGSTIICSACPIKGGFHHLNPQPKEYWIEKFERREFKYCKDEVEKLESIFQQMRCSGWFKTGLKIFRKDN